MVLAADLEEKWGDFDSLLSALQAPEGIKPQILKRLYISLVSLANNPKWSLTSGLNSDPLEMEINQEGIVLKFSVIHKLSNILFKELSERFEQFFNSVNDPEILLLLLRCCLVILIQLVEQQNLLIEKTQILLVILRKLSSFQFTETEKTKNVSFVSAIFEVFIDELAIHGKLRYYLKLTDSAFSLGEKNLFVTHYCQGSIGILAELISSHFALSFSDEKAIEDSINRLFYVPFRACEVSIQAATSLLLNPIINSSPKCMQAHIISLVSETCTNTMNLQSFKSNPRIINCFLSIFEKSVSLYHEYISTLKIEGLVNKHANRRTKSQPSFESYISPDKRIKINDLVRIFEEYSDSKLRNIVTKSEMVNSITSYVKENRNVVEIETSFHDEILLILNNLILKASSSFDDVAKDVNLQDIYLLSSVLKLMSTSLLSVIVCLKHSKNLENTRIFKEFDFILSIISCFKEFSIDSPIEEKLFLTKHEDSRTMFIHFTGLLSLGFSNGLDCLAKGCVLIIKAVLNLFIFEEGNLDVLQSLFENVSSESSLIKVHESIGNHNSSLVVASKFQQIRTLYSRPVTRSNSCMGKDGNSEALEGSLGMEEETEEATNGEMYLKCVLEDKKISDFDDLADFIECKEGKNYASWLKNRQKYRNWKSKKMAALRWKRKKEVIKGMNR